MSEEQEYLWGDFKDWCEDTGVNLADREDWACFWDCWKAAIDTHTEAAKDSPPSERKEPA